MLISKLLRRFDSRPSKDASARKSSVPCSYLETGQAVFLAYMAVLKREVIVGFAAFLIISTSIAKILSVLLVLSGALAD
jgi:hypothetical protein